MTAVPRIITSNQSLFAQYHDLQKGDIVCGRVRLRPNEEYLLLDLSRRGIIGIPSFVSQLCSRSKTMQARLYEWAMVPGTTAIYTIHDLLETVNRYGREGFDEVVLKLESRNGGLGIFRYSSIEDVYSQSALGQIPYPYVVQPFVKDCRDVRIIALNDYWEAYERCNADNFRNNLHCGGTARPVELTAEQRELCTRVMRQNDFHYAHLDLMVTEDGRSFLGEINLRGGLRGARISADDYQRRTRAIEKSCCEKAAAERT